MDFTNIIFAVIVFALLGGAIGALLAVASRVFAVPVNEKAEQIVEVLPGANCGGCGFSGCAALAEAIANGKAKPNSCTVGGDAVGDQVAAIMGVKAEKAVKMRAQVMCSGAKSLSKQKYDYQGITDCVSAMQLGGGSRLCPNGCIGLGTCVAKCPFDAIELHDGVAFVDYKKCQGCGVCVAACPKGIIKLIPFDSKHWVGCMSQDKGAATRSYCDVGCIGCRICEKNCEAGAIKIDGFLASIDYDKCTGCDKCVEKCPRKIIWSGESQARGPVIKLN
jgi:Na+-translocating ferredoxin:NAD+ oxidoreductase RNF subunit RnfB